MMTSESKVRPYFLNADEAPAIVKAGPQNEIRAVVPAVIGAVSVEIGISSPTCLAPSVES